jgi:hypothetical protein
VRARGSRGRAVEGGEGAARWGPKLSGAAQRADDDAPTGGARGQRVRASVWGRADWRRQVSPTSQRARERGWAGEARLAGPIMPEKGGSASLDFPFSLEFSIRFLFIFSFEFKSNQTTNSNLNISNMCIN